MMVFSLGDGFVAWQFPDGLGDKKIGKIVYPLNGFVSTLKVPDDMSIDEMFNVLGYETTQLVNKDLELHLKGSVK
jgi:hypothetical protein